MPSGVFKPYAGVSTAVLVFTKTGHGGTDNVWFYDMTADGFSLDDKRSPVSENDIPDIVARFHNPEGEKTRPRTEKSFWCQNRRSWTTITTFQSISTKRRNINRWNILPRKRFSRS